MRCRDKLKKNVNDEINSKTAAGSIFYSLRQIFRSKVMNETVTSKTYKSVAVYRSETGAMNGLDMNRLGTWESKILRTIYGVVEEHGLWRIRSNQELRVLYEDLDVETDVKKKRLEWIGLVVRKNQERTVKKIVEGRSSRWGRLRFRWLEDVEKDPLEIKDKKWRGQAFAREEWASIIKEAKALRGVSK